MPGNYRTEHVAEKPQGWRVRTIATHTGHEIRLGFPPGRRRKGSGRLLEILHPSHENPSCEVTPPRAAELVAKKLGIQNPAELLIIGANGSQRNPGELLILGANPSPAEQKKAARDRAARIRGARLNPEGETQQDKAADLYREFQGKEPTEMVEIQRSDRIRKDYTGLADLEALVLVHNFTAHEWNRFRSDMAANNGDLGRVHKPADTGLLFFERRDGVKLASNPDGTQLYCLGGNQDLTACLLELGADPTKDLIDLGYCICVRYIASKAHNNFDPGLYWHCLGEESGQPPRIMYDKLKQEIYFIGGAYVVRAPGIIN